MPSADLAHRMALRREKALAKRVEADGAGAEAGGALEAAAALAAAQPQ